MPALDRVLGRGKRFGNACLGTCVAAVFERASFVALIPSGVIGNTSEFGSGVVGSTPTGGIVKSEPPVSAHVGKAWLFGSEDMSSWRITFRDVERM